MSDIPLGFEYQPKNEGSCGAYALGHALNLLGQTGQIEDHKKSSNYRSWSKSIQRNFSFWGLLSPIKTFISITSYIGTGERGILSGIKKSGFTSIAINNYSMLESQKILDSHLEEGCPVILYANWDQYEEDGGHWYVCAGKSKNKYIIIDSSPLLASKNIISIYSWEEISRRSIVYTESSKYFQFFGFAIQPENKLSAVLRLPKHLSKLQRDECLREWWGYYLDDLKDIFDTVGSSENVINSGEFFTKYSAIFLENARYWNVDIEKSRMEKELSNYQVVADAYNFAITKSRLDLALIGFTAALITAAQVE